jgi:mono/diheme cytochrome c family protein
MKRLFVLIATWVAITSAAAGYSHAVNSGHQASTLRTAASTPAPIESHRALLKRYCITCHNERTRTGNLALDQIDLAEVGPHAETWEKVVRKLRAGVMPPAGLPRPDQATYDAFVVWLEGELDHAATTHPNPGRTETFHRLNRAEYQNAIRDLLALDIDATALLPADDGSYGFDNIAGVLKISPVLMERYVVAAREISALAMGEVPRSPAAETYRVHPELLQYDHVDGLPFGTRGGVRIRHTFPVDAEYEFQIALGRASWQGYSILGLSAEPHDMELTLDGERVKVFSVSRQSAGGPQSEYSKDSDPEAHLTVRVPVTAGPHEVSVAFLRKTSALIEEDLRQPFKKPYLNQVYQPHVGAVTISGPFDAVARADDTPSRQRILVCRPESAADELACARSILSTLARRAYRRPVHTRDLDELLEFYAAGRKEANFETGIQMALRRVLVSPEFLFRIERDPVRGESGDAPDRVTEPQNYRLTDLELASRLSFFLWSSIPDDELLMLAERGRLRDAAVVEQQVRRMLADSRATALVKNFAGQWLYLRNLPAIRPDEALFPDFDEALRLAFQRETELFFENIIREDRSVLELLKADYTFVNERLARHYGIKNVYGDNFRRVTLGSDSNRGGLLGQGSILTVTSHANRTSPVVRGKWILENVLGTPAPPPPPNVPPLEEKPTKGKVLTVRERMAQHRANPTCASCHKLIDPLGFALENFDAVGRWRTLESGTPIDSTGTLPDGVAFESLVEFRELLLGRSDLFVTTMTEKLLIYALGRGLEYYDAPTVRAITRAAARDDYRFSALILGVVNSTPFQMRRPES